MGVGEEEEALGNDLQAARTSRAAVVQVLAIRAVLPGEAGEVVVGQVWRRGEVGIGLQHPIDVVKEGQDLLLGVQRVEEDGAAVEQQQRHVGERAGPQAAALGEMDAVAQLPPLPLLVIEVHRDRGVAAIRVAAAAASGADEQVALLADHVDGLAIGAEDEVAPQRATRGRSGHWVVSQRIRATRSCIRTRYPPSGNGSNRRGSSAWQRWSSSAVGSGQQASARAASASVGYWRQEEIRSSSTSASAPRSYSTFSRWT